MCVIIALEPGQMIPYANLANACFNNWHSYGLVTLDVNCQDHLYDMQVIRKVPENGEVNPDEVYNLLNEKKDLRRILHLRHNTAGATTLENTHPFEVYNDEETGRRVVFMHNGTLYDYKSKKLDPTLNKMVDDNTGPSDTANFVEEVLKPYTDIDFGDGFGDIENDLYQRIITKFWPATGNRGILISNDNPVFFLGDWKDVTFGDQKILCSNNDYFYSVTRGPEHTRRLVRQAEANKKAAEANGKAPEKAQSVGENDNPYVLLKTFTEKIKSLHPAHNLPLSMKNLIGDIDLWDREKAAPALGYMTRDEIRELLKGGEEYVVAIIDYIFTDYGSLYEEYQELEEKKYKAELLIESLRKGEVA